MTEGNLKVRFEWLSGNSLQYLDVRLLAKTGVTSHMYFKFNSIE